MKVCFKNIVYRMVTEYCFLCNLSRFCTVPGINVMYTQCLADEDECTLGNLYNDKIFKL